MCNTKTLDDLGPQRSKLSSSIYCIAGSESKYTAIRDKFAVVENALVHNFGAPEKILEDPRAVRLRRRVDEDTLLEKLGADARVIEDEQGRSQGAVVLCFRNVVEEFLDNVNLIEKLQAPLAGPDGVLNLIVVANMDG